jgi:hypothetical protein
MAPKRKSVAKNSSVSAVVNTLKATEALPADLKSLLGSTLPVVLGACKADRHAFESEIVDKAAESLTIAQKSCEAEHAAAVSTQNEVVSKGERTKRDAATKEAEAKQKGAQETVAACEGVRKERAKAVDEAESAVKAAQKAEKDADKVEKKSESTKTNLHAVSTIHFAALIEGTFTKAAEKKKAIQSVVKLGKEHGVGNTLSQAFAMACNTATANRSAFESTTFETVKGKLDAAFQAVSKQHEDDVATVEAKKAVSAAAKATLSQAQEALTDAETQLATAKEALKEAKKGFTQAVAFRHKVWSDMKSACDAQDALADALKEFKEVIWPAFEELKEKTPPPPPPVEEAEAEEPPEKKQRTEEAAADGNAD